MIVQDETTEGKIGRLKVSPGNITGRDVYIVYQALAYAIEAIERLPEERQEWSNKEDMKLILYHHAGKLMAEDHRLSAASHLDETVEEKYMGMKDRGLSLDEIMKHFEFSGLEKLDG